MIFNRFSRLSRRLIFLTVFVSVAGCAATAPVRRISYPDPVVMDEVTAPSSEQADARTLRVYPLPLYEKLVYEMRWLGMRVGTVTATIKGVTEFEGREVYQLELLAVSNSWLGRIYRIESRFESLLDVDTMSTLRQQVDRKEGGYRKDATILYDHDQQRASFHNRTDDTRKVYAVPHGVLDALSSIYYFRTIPLRQGSRVGFDVDVNEKVYEFGAAIQAAKPVRLSGFPDQAAVYVQPYVTFEDENVRKGRVRGYFSQGPYQIPLTATIEAPIFTKATVTLIEASYSRNNSGTENL